MRALVRILRACRGSAFDAWVWRTAAELAVEAKDFPLAARCHARAVECEWRAAAKPAPAPDRGKDGGGDPPSLVAALAFVGTGAIAVAGCAAAFFAGGPAL